MFVLLSGSAAVGEEATYRGATFMTLAALTGSWWLSAIATAALFGLAHATQGVRSAALIALYGVRDHLVVGLTGTLYVMMVIHFLHDAVVGFWGAARARREDDVVAAPAAP